MNEIIAAWEAVKDNLLPALLGLVAGWLVAKSQY